MSNIFFSINDDMAALFKEKISAGPLLPTARYICCTVPYADFQHSESNSSIEYFSDKTPIAFCSVTDSSKMRLVLLGKSEISVSGRA